MRRMPSVYFAEIFSLLHLVFRQGETSLKRSDKLNSLRVKFMLSSLFLALKEEMVSTLLAISTLNSSRFMPGAATSIMVFVVIFANVHSGQRSPTLRGG